MTPLPLRGTPPCRGAKEWGFGCPLLAGRAGRGQPGSGGPDAPRREGAPDGKVRRLAGVQERQAQRRGLGGARGDFPRCRGGGLRPRGSAHRGRRVRGPRRGPGDDGRVGVPAPRHGGGAQEKALRRGGAPGAAGCGGGGEGGGLRRHGCAHGPVWDGRSGRVECDGERPLAGPRDARAHLG